jgi:mono/diheme cytochrome c family protein
MPRCFPVLVLIAALGAGAAARGDQPPEINYKLHCMGCHLADGSGGPPAVPDIRREMGCLLAVEGGREYLVQVPGAAQAPISDAELAAVLNYMLETFSASVLPPEYLPVTREEVTRWRGSWLTEVAAVRETLLARVQARCPAGP